MRYALLFSIAVAGLLSACLRHEVTREQWLRGSAEDRELIVRSFLGGEQAAESKGGGGRAYSRTPSFYRQEIDRRYAAGDTRTVAAIWRELSDEALAGPPPQ